jgi:hypothetical protein
MSVADLSFGGATDASTGQRWLGKIGSKGAPGSVSIRRCRQFVSLRDFARLGILVSLPPL